MIKTEHLVKSYGKGELELMVLKKLSLLVQKGEFVAIIGPSGAGKSTLLYQLSLLDTPTSGTVHINGKSMSGLPEKEKTQFRLRELGYFPDQQFIVKSLQRFQRSPAAYQN